MAQAYAYDVGDYAFHGSYEGHFEAAAPPGTHGDQGLGRAYGEMG
jgi:hypothetical protein